MLWLLLLLISFQLLQLSFFATAAVAVLLNFLFFFFVDFFCFFFCFFTLFSFLFLVVPVLVSLCLSFFLFFFFLPPLSFFLSFFLLFFFLSLFLSFFLSVFLSFFSSSYCVIALVFLLFSVQVRHSNSEWSILCYIFCILGFSLTPVGICLHTGVKIDIFLSLNRFSKSYRFHQ